MTGTTHARRLGNGSRPALALHCALGHSGGCIAVAEALADHIQLTAIDLPGHGQSKGWDGETDFFDASTDAAAGYLDQRPVDIIGHSFGAVVGLRLALEHPNRVRSLSLFEPVFFAAAQAAEPEAFAKAVSDVPRFEVALQAGDKEKAARLFNRYWGEGTRWDAFSDKARRYMTDRIHLIPAQNPGLIEDKAGLLGAGRLEGLRLPVLVLHGDKSPPVVRLINRALAARLPDVRIAVVKGAGHMAPLTHPHSIAAEIVKLLEKA